MKHTKHCFLLPLLAILCALSFGCANGRNVKAPADRAVVGLVNSIGMKFVWIPAGEYDKGSPEDEPGRRADEKLHRVKIERPFLMATTTVTQAQWMAVMGNDPSTFMGDDRPVEMVSWNDAGAFCARLGAREGRQYRLPTEAEWEYACRAGTQGPYGGTGNLDEMGWYGDRRGLGTHPVGLKKPNAWGLYDMHGNVWQWCSDGAGFAVRRDGFPDPRPQALRGGSWCAEAGSCRSAYRHSNSPFYRSPMIGLRVCIDADPGNHPSKPIAAVKAGKILSLTIAPGVSMKLAMIPAGTFTMGSPVTEEGRDTDETPHLVTLTKPFHMATTHVTVGQWKVFINETGYRTDAEKQGWAYVWTEGRSTKLAGASWRKPGFEQTDDHPVVLVSWNDAIKFCDWLSIKLRRNVSLPTEAQFEFASRAGTDTAYFWGNAANGARLCANCADLTFGDRFPMRQPTAGWHDGFAFTSPVGSFKPNAWGLYDMIGNAWEWCADSYSDYSTFHQIDPIVSSRFVLGRSEEAEYRVLRGGSWFNDPLNCRAAIRIANTPDGFENYAGFRVCIEVEESQ